MVIKNVIGKKITFGLNTNDSEVIIGVLPAETNFPARVDVYTPTEIKREDFDRGGSHNWRTIARLKPGISIEQAQAEINTLAQRQAELYPDTNKGWQVQVQSLRDCLFGNSRAALLLLFGAVAIVLVIACANVTNLQLGRIHSRRRELAVRLALGAGRFRIVRQFLIENVLLSILGGTLGVFVAAPDSLIIPVQQRLQALGSRGVVFNVRPFDQFVADAVASRRFNLWLFSAFGFLAALLAAAGIYATMNFAVVRRHREIGIEWRWAHRRVR